MLKSFLPNKEFRKLVPKLREKGFYHSQEQRKISWKEYNLSLIEEAPELMCQINNLVDSCIFIKQKKVGKPLTNPKYLVKAILVAELLSLPERQAEGWMKILSPFMKIKKLDDRVIGNAYNRIEIAFILRQIFDKIKNSDGILSGDGTGIETSRKQNYGLNKKSAKEFLTSIVDSREIVQAFDFNGKDECKAMHSLIKKVDGKKLMLDAGFVDRKLAMEIKNLGIKPFIFPRKNLTLNGNSAWKSMYQDLYFDVQQWLKEYHQRSHCESFHSSFKRRNKPLMKINSLSKLNQLTARIIIHNLRKLFYFNKLSKC